MAGTNTTPTPQLSQPSVPPPQLSAGWRVIGEQQEFYDDQDCLHPTQESLVSEKLGDREEDDVVIFDYLLNPDFLREDGDSPSGSEDGGSSSGAGDGDSSSGADYDIFFRVSKHELTESAQFGQIINNTSEPRPIEPEGQRLGIIDFPQCYDTSDGDLLNSMAEKLGLPGGNAFAGAHARRVSALPGHGPFRTGISFQAPFEGPQDSSRSDASNDKFTLFASFPYFGKFSDNIVLDLSSESVRLLDFKHLGVNVPGHEGEVAGRDDIGDVLVHQARYMIFDNYTMATFRSKEDTAKDQAPLHRFQERIGAFRSVVHMIANRMGLELWALGQLQASLCKLEEGIDRLISDAEMYEDTQGIEPIPEDELPPLQLQPGRSPTAEEEEQWKKDGEQFRQKSLRKRKRKRVRDLLTSLNRLSAGLFAAISVAERQIAVLQDLHSVFFISYRTKSGDNSSRRRNPFYKNIAQIPILCDNREQIWPKTLDTIDEVVRARKAFIKKVKELVENTDARGKILFGFLKSDQAQAAAEESTNAMKSTEDTIAKKAEEAARIMQESKTAMEKTETTIADKADEAAHIMKDTQNAINEAQKALVQQAQTLSGFTLVTTAFLPLSFCASYFGMSNVNTFEGKTMSRRDFWLTTGPVLAGVLLLTLIIVLWRRKVMKVPRKIFGGILRNGGDKLVLFSKKLSGQSSSRSQNQTGLP